MRLLHVLDHSLPLQSGYVVRTLGILGAQRGFGWDTLHLTTPRNNGGVPQEETVDGWTFHRTGKPVLPAARLPVMREMLEMRVVSKRISELIARYRPDIVHAHSPALNGLPALRAARKHGLPLVYEVRGLWEDAAVDHGTSREGDLRYRTTRGLETYLIRRADAVVTLCEPMRRELAGRGISDAKIAVVPNAVDLAAFSESRPPDPELTSQLGLTGRKVFGFIGSFYHYEGLDLLLSAVPEMRAAMPETAVLLVGGGNEAGRLREQARRLGIEDTVRFTGRVPHDQVQRYYDLVDFFIYPRRSMRLTELVTPLKPLEAMAQRRIVLASDIGGHRELIRDGVTGFLFPPGDPTALARCAITAARTPDHSATQEAGRLFVETERTWVSSASNYKPVYERVRNSLDQRT